MRPRARRAAISSRRRSSVTRFPTARGVSRGRMRRAARVIRPVTIETGTMAPTSRTTQTVAISSVRAAVTRRPERSSRRWTRSGRSMPGSPVPTSTRDRPGSSTRDRTDSRPTDSMRATSTVLGRSDSNRCVQPHSWQRAVPRTTVAPPPRPGSTRRIRWGVGRPHVSQGRVERCTRGRRRAPSPGSEGAASSVIGSVTSPPLPSRFRRRPRLTRPSRPGAPPRAPGPRGRPPRPP